jgi:hypothetical protein
MLPDLERIPAGTLGKAAGDYQGCSRSCSSRAPRFNSLVILGNVVSA